jgi:hypothetical protein
MIVVILPNAWTKTVPIQMIVRIHLVKMIIVQTALVVTLHCALTNHASIQLNVQVAQEIALMNFVLTQKPAAIILIV